MSLECPGAMNLGRILRGLRDGNILEKLKREPGEEDFSRLGEDINHPELVGGILQGLVPDLISGNNFIRKQIGEYGLNEQGLERYRSALGEHVKSCKRCRKGYNGFIWAQMPDVEPDEARRKAREFDKKIFGILE